MSQIDENCKSLFEKISPRLEPLLGPLDSWQIGARFMGNMNDIYRIKDFGLKLRVIPPLLGLFDGTLIKEAYVISLIQNQPTNIAKFTGDWLGKPSGGPLDHPLIHHIYLYDHGGEVAFCLYDWIEGDILWQVPTTQNYYQAGQTLAQLHTSLKMPYFTDSLQDLAQGKSQSWQQKFTGRMNYYLNHAKDKIGTDLHNALTRLTVEIPNLAVQPILCHHDFTGGNLIVSPKGIHVIDWDVCDINPAEADLISMKYFTHIGPDGILAPNPSLYQEFLNGYQEVTKQEINHQILYLEEIKWLLRLYLYFGYARRDTAGAKGHNMAELYPKAEFFMNHLMEMIKL